MCAPFAKTPTHQQKLRFGDSIENIRLLRSGLGDYLFVHRRRGEGEGDKAADYAVPRILERYDEYLNNSNFVLTYFHVLQFWA
eukprot:COSAG06_NODE_122_length_23062_cov_43.568990_9_plen_83_part_00